MPKFTAKTLLTLAKEATSGVEQADSIPDDVLEVSDGNLNPNAQRIDIPEVTGSKDRRPGQRGPMLPAITGRHAIRGGVLITDRPQLRTFLEICGLRFHDFDTAPIPASSTTTIVASSGTTTSVNVDRSGGGSDWPNVEDAVEVLGCPIELVISGTTYTPAVIGYKLVSGSIWRLDLSEAPTGSAIPNGATVRVPPRQKYAPDESTDVSPSATARMYEDGVRTMLLGCRGLLTVQLQNLNPLFLGVDVRGTFAPVPDADVTQPTYVTNRAALPPIWRNGAFTYGQRRLAGNAFNVNVQSRIELPDDPNEAEGLGPAEIVERTIGGDLTVQLLAKASMSVLTDLRDQVPRPLHARAGSVAGNRIAITVPTGLLTGVSTVDSKGFIHRRPVFEADGIGQKRCQVVLY